MLGLVLGHRQFRLQHVDFDAVLPRDLVAPGEPDASPGLYTLERREIGTGASTVSRIEVVSGLAEGELVVSDRLQEMSDGLVVSGGSLL